MNEMNTSAATQVFVTHRPRLLGIAYRMLGSWAEAEDLVQDAFLRWHRTAREHIESPLAFLVTITTRLSLDRLRELKREREHCVVMDEPEATCADPSPSPEARRIQAQDVSIAFDAVMERLGTDERAAFLLREIFDYDYAEIARLVGKAEPACRQLIHRARNRVRESNPRFTLTPDSRVRVMQKFQAAMTTGSHPHVMALLAEPVEYVEAAGAASARCHKMAA